MGVSEMDEGFFICLTWVWMLVAYIHKAQDKRVFYGDSEICIFGAGFLFSLFKDSVLSCKFTSVRQSQRQYHNIYFPF